MTECWLKIDFSKWIEIRCPFFFRDISAERFLLRDAWSTTGVTRREERLPTKVCGVTPMCRKSHDKLQWGPLMQAISASNNACCARSDMLCFDVTGLYPQPPWWRRLFSAPPEIGFQVLKDQNYEKSTGNTSQLNTVQRKHGANYSFAIINGPYKFLTCFFVTSNANWGVNAISKNKVDLQDDT